MNIILNPYKFIKSVIIIIMAKIRIEMHEWYRNTSLEKLKF